MHTFLAEPIYGHEQHHWQVVEVSPVGMDMPYCETVNKEKARHIADLLNDDEPTDVFEDDQPFVAEASCEEP